MKNMIAFLWIGLLLVGCAPVALTPDVNALSTQAVATAYVEITQTALPTITPTLPPISEALLPAECLQLDERLGSNVLVFKNTAPWAKSQSCHLFVVSADQQFVAYVHLTYNSDPEMEQKCSTVTKTTPELCRADQGKSQTVKILTVQTGEIHDLYKVENHAEMVVRLEWLPSGELSIVFFGGTFANANLTYDPATRLVFAAASPTPFPTPVSPLPVQIKEQVYVAETAWSPDGQTLAMASCYAGCRLELLNPADLSQVWSVELKDRIRELRFSPDGKSLAIVFGTLSRAYNENTKTYQTETEIRLINARNGADLWKGTLTAGFISGFEFSPNGENLVVLFATSGQDAPNEIQFLDASDGKILRQWKAGSAKGLSYSPSGEQIVTTGEKLAIWNVSSGGRRWEIDPQKFAERSGGICQVDEFDQASFSQNQAYLFARGTGSECGVLLALNLETQKLVFVRTESNPYFHASALYFDEATSELLFHEPYLGLRRWKVNTQEVIPMNQAGHLDIIEVLEVAAQPNQSWLVLSTLREGQDSYHFFYLYNRYTGEWLTPFSTQVDDWHREEAMNSPAFSSDGHWLAAANQLSGRLRIWDIPYIPAVAATAEPNSSPTPSSTSAFSCPLAPNPRVKVGDLARITFTTGQKTRLRSIPEAGENVVAMLAEGTEFKIIDGPRCYLRPGTNQAYVYWKIFITSTSQAGWLAEGDADSYFIEPLP